MMDEPKGYTYFLLVKHGDAGWEFASFPPEPYESYAECKAAVDNMARENPGARFAAAPMADILMDAFASFARYAPKGVAVVAQELERMTLKQ